MQARPELRDAPENFLESMLAKPEYSEPDVIGNVFTMLFAGEDTTANTLAWATWLLAQRPGRPGAAAAEADAALGDDRTPQTAEAADAMVFGEAVFRESSRLKSTAPIIFVEPKADTAVAGVELPAGTRIACLTRLAGRPDGPERFDPDRWLANGAQPEPSSRSAPARASARAATSRSWRARRRWRCSRATSRWSPRARRRARAWLHHEPARPPGEAARRE